MHHVYPKALSAKWQPGCAPQRLPHVLLDDQPRVARWPDCQMACHVVLPNGSLRAAAPAASPDAAVGKLAKAAVARAVHLTAEAKRRMEDATQEAQVIF